MENKINDLLDTISFLKEQQKEVYIYCNTNPDYIKPEIMYESLQKEIEKLSNQHLRLEIIEGIQHN